MPPWASSSQRPPSPTGLPLNTFTAQTRFCPRPGAHGLAVTPAFGVYVLYSTTLLNVVAPTSTFSPIHESSGCFSVIFQPDAPGGTAVFGFPVTSIRYGCVASFAVGLSLMMRRSSSSYSSWVSLPRML